MSETYELVMIDGSGRRERCVVRVASAPPWWVRLECADGSHKEASSGSDLFEALVGLRCSLEEDGWLLACVGALPNVYPSGMSRQMSGGRVAYLHDESGQAVDEVDIFAPADAADVVSVEVQRSRWGELRAAFEAFEGRVRTDLPESLVAEAQRNPGGWVYEIDGEFTAEAGVPPGAIRGAWRVNDHGQIVGEFIPNRNYRGRKG